MPIFFLALATALSVVLAPVVAGYLVLSEAEASSSRWVAWLGMSIGVGAASTVPLFGAFLAVTGDAWGYRLAPLVGMLGLVLGVRIVRVHRCRLRGESVSTRSTAWACAGFALLVATALAPWIAGAPLPTSGELAAESSGPGDVHAYARMVVPVVLTMALEAWTLLRAPRVPSPIGRTTAS